MKYWYILPCLLIQIQRELLLLAEEKVCCVCVCVCVCVEDVPTVCLLCLICLLTSSIMLLT